MTLRRKSTEILLANWLAVPLQLVSSVIVIRLLGAEGRGTLVVLNTLVLVLATLGQFGFLASATYHLRKGLYAERTLIANYLVVIVGMSVVSGGLIVGGGGLFSRLFLDGASAAVPLALTMCALPLMMFTNFVAALLLAKGQARAYSSVTVIPALASVLLTVGLVAGLDLGVTGAMLAFVLSLGLGALVGGVPMLRATAGQQTKVTRRSLSDLGRFGLSYYVVTLSSQVFKRGDIFLLAYFLNREAVAYYSIGVTLYEAILTLPRAVSGLIAGEAAGQAREKAGALVARASRGVLWSMAISAVVIGFMSYWLIPPVYGSDFTQARGPALILLASAVLFGFTLSIQNYFIGVGRPGVIAVLSVIPGIANLGLSIVLIPREGIVGNALATLLGASLGMALVLFWFARIAQMTVRSTYLPPPTELFATVKRRALRLQEKGG